MGVPIGDFTKYHGFKVVCVQGCLLDVEVRSRREILDIRVSHSWACTWSAMAIFWALRGSCRYVSTSGGSSWNETSCAISASVLT